MKEENNIDKKIVDFQSTQLYINKKEDVDALNEDFNSLGLTNKSMINDNTWRTAHLVSGISSFIVGTLMFVFAIVYNKSAQINEVGLYEYSTLICFVEIFIFIITNIVPTEIALAIKYDKDGNYK